MFPSSSWCSLQPTLSFLVLLVCVCVYVYGVAGACSVEVDAAPVPCLVKLPYEVMLVVVDM